MLAYSWARQTGSRHVRLFGSFVILCASSFLATIALAVPLFATDTLATIRSLLVALVPPMMLHLALQREGWSVPFPMLWRAMLGAVYVGAVLPAGLDNPAMGLAVASGGAILALLVCEGRRNPAEIRHRTWNIAILILLCASVLGSSLDDSLVFEFAPDYLLLAFFAVWLYYSERLAFFDVFLRGGAYFLLGAVVIGAATVVTPSAGPAVVLLGAWLVGPVVHARVAALVDRMALKRRMAPPQPNANSISQFNPPLQKTNCAPWQSACSETSSSVM